MRHSGLQKEVLSLYRHCLRESRKKPAVSSGSKDPSPSSPPSSSLAGLVGCRESTRAHFEKFARTEFSRNLSLDKRDFAAIEFLLRKGRRQLDTYSSPGIKDIR
ncbi:hypothetical protein E4U43_007429 [Claviceps pusilla]|uniref:Complex 1 LYR protein domain-containing protein n=1 Tax=Claviceps pusilla TaxID=123648 RepID=A0A9P7NEX2_9HYPO|nr:hypothetical protein E4U43_007429 [Claviceps pusilla]